MSNILNMINELGLSTDNVDLCICGRNHNLITKDIYIGNDAHSYLLDFINNNFCAETYGVIICDANTYKASARLINHLEERCKTATLDINSFHADLSMVTEAEKVIESISVSNSFSADFFIAAGSGTIHDITRVVAERAGKPFISFPTAPSVDGFVSTVAPVTENGMKKTLQAVAPVALFADTEIICTAPKRLTASGIGDIIGKYISLADWKIANLMTGEYICDKIISLEYDAVNKAKQSVTDMKNAKPQNKTKAYEDLCINLLEALVISGICMQLIGNSRPASGAEHHIAHFLEMGILSPPDFNLDMHDSLHGENVGIGSILCADFYHKFAETDNSEIKFRHNSEIEYDLIKAYYKDLFDEIVRENTPNQLVSITPEKFYASIDSIKAIIKTIPAKAEFIEVLEAVEGVTHINSKDKNKIAELALKLAPYVRNRFTFLKISRLI